MIRKCPVIDVKLTVLILRSLLILREMLILQQLSLNS